MSSAFKNSDNKSPVKGAAYFGSQEESLKY